ncbi:MAG: hypothetical protein LBH05_03365 [Deferribacteraceae bacterium]|jgi:hypothetical protein|nr:hypothetical protein [Deferribacteraceae bacterium]
MSLSFKILLLVFISVYAVADDIPFRNIDLEGNRKEFGLPDENSADIQWLKVDPGKTDMQDVGRDNLEQQAQDPNSAVYSVVRVKTPTDSEKDDMEKTLNAFTPPTDLYVNITTEKDNFTPNIVQGAVQLWIAGEIAKDATSNLGVGNGTPQDNASLEKKIMQSKIFGANHEECYKYNEPPYYDYCSVKATVKTKYQCEETEETFSDYNSCKPNCDAVCKRFTEYDTPKLEILGMDFTTVAGTSPGAKRLAAGKAMNVCQAAGSRRDTYCKTKVFGKCVLTVLRGWTYDYCCFSSPVSMGLSNAIKDQLNLNKNSCEGIPLSRLNEIDFNDPKIVAVMEKQVGNVVDTSMYNDFQNKYSNQPHDNSSATQMGNTINAEIENRKIPGI